MVEKTSQFYNSSAEKVMKIIEIIANDKEKYLGISQISRLSVLDKSAVYRMINTLYDLGYLNKSSDAKYGLSNNFIIIANKILLKMDNREVINSYLIKVASHANHFSSFSIIENNKAVLIDKVEAKISLRVHSEVGKTYPLNCSATGKAYLSTLTDQEIDDLYKKIPLMKMTEKSIIDLDELKKDIRSVRARGYAINNQEHDLYRISMAVAIKNMKGDFIGGMGISMPAMAQEMESLDEYGQYLKSISIELSKELK